MAIEPCGRRTQHLSPAAAEYAAAEAEVFPVEAHMTTWLSASTALEMAMVIPRSLKEPVGFKSLVFQIDLQAVTQLFRYVFLRKAGACFLP